MDKTEAARLSVGDAVRTRHCKGTVDKIFPVSTNPCDSVVGVRLDDGRRIIRRAWELQKEPPNEST